MKRRKKECPTHQVFLEAERAGATCAADTDILKNIIYLVVRIGHYPDGTRVTEATYTIDGKWKMIAKVLGGTVIAWKPFPEPYKEN